MACATCGNSILFGGKRAGSRRYCSKKCFNGDELGRRSDLVSEADAAKLAKEIRDSECPKCNRKQGLDIFKSYFIYSIVVLTSWKTNPVLCCRSCGKTRQLRDFFGSFFLGWWGIPFGILATPVVLAMNIGALFSDPSAKPPSKALLEHARLLIAQDAMQNPKSFDN